jgi:hypothetical protein
MSMKPPLLLTVVAISAAASLGATASAHADVVLNACPQLNDSGPFLHSAAVSDVTSCPFAEDVRLHFNSLSARVRASGLVTIWAHSPTTGDSYPMNCVPGTEVRGDGARVESERCIGGVGDSAVVDLW